MQKIPKDVVIVIIVMSRRVCDNVQPAISHCIVESIIPDDFASVGHCTSPSLMPVVENKRTGMRPLVNLLVA